MAWQCLMGAQTKSIKSLNPGQGHGDPSPQGDPDNHQILLFRRWHVIKAPQGPVTLRIRASLFASKTRFITNFVRLSVGSLPSPFFHKSWTGCGAKLWYSSELTVHVFKSCQAWEVWTTSCGETWGIWQRAKREAATTPNKKCIDRGHRSREKQTRFSSDVLSTAVMYRKCVKLLQFVLKQWRLLPAVHTTRSRKSPEDRRRNTDSILALFTCNLLKQDLKPLKSELS